MNNSRSLIIIMLMAILSENVFGATYAGFEVCKAATSEAIIKIIESADGIVRTATDDEGRLTYSVVGDNYPVANARVNVMVELIKGKISSVQIKHAYKINGATTPDELKKSLDLHTVLTDKYGSPAKQTDENIPYVGRLVTSYYNNPKDPQVEVSSSFFSGNLNIDYYCTPLEKQRRVEVKQKQANERKKASTGKSL